MKQMQKPSHCELYGEGNTYYPRQNGGARDIDSDGFVSNCLISNAHKLAKVNYVISNKVTIAIQTYFYDEMLIEFCNRTGKINQMARVIQYRDEGNSNTD